ncbi:MAG: restriction endonuclease FokI C-terminal domain-containing protein [Faecalibacillus sp.]
MTTNNEDVFYLNYINVAEQGNSGAKNFEVLTTTLFKEIFQSNAKYVGNLPKHPDVYLLDDILTGLIDNKSYQRNYSITNDHKNRMIQNYIPTFIDENNVHPLFFIYIASSLSNTTKKNIDGITDSTSVHGSAITANNLVQMAKLYFKNKISIYSIRDLFMSNKEIIYSDLIKYIN